MNSHDRRHQVAPNQKEGILRALRDAYPGSVSGATLSRISGSNYPARRINELRNEGWDIESLDMDPQTNTQLYRLKSYNQIARRRDKIVGLEFKLYSDGSSEVRCHQSETDIFHLRDQLESAIMKVLAANNLIPGLQPDELDLLLDL